MPNTIKAYMKMILDGTAFCDWENPPDRDKRAKLVESIMGDRKFKFLISESKNEEELKRLLYDMQIKEEEFLV